MNDPLDDKISVKLAEALAANRAVIVARAGGPLEREAMKMAFPMLLREVPNIVESVLTAVRAEFGAMTLDDLMDYMGKAAK